MTQRRLPEFLFIGAVKAATTWIAHQLRGRSDVFMPGPEPHYFTRAYDRGEDWYASLFAGAAPEQHVGEKSADYLADPDAPRRAAALLPDTMLVAQLRDPVERAYSDYCMLYRRGQVDGDVARYLERGTTAPRFLNDGLYARHIARWRDHFPADRLKIILYDEIRSEPERVVADVSSFLGLAPVIEPERVRQRMNDSEAPLVPLPLRRLPQPLKDLVAPWRGSAAFKAARNLIARPVRYPPLTRELRLRLSDYYREDVIQLGAMLGRDLSAWSSQSSPAP